MTEQEIKDKVQELAPFNHNVELPYGLRTYSPELSRREVERTRFTSWVKHAWASLLELCDGSFRGQRILDVGCNCGGFSTKAAKSGAEYVLGIDIVDHYLEQANFIKHAWGLKQVEFKKMAIEDLDGKNVGQYDITLCLGLLYHLENPVQAMRKLSSVTRRMLVVDTKLIHCRFGNWRSSLMRRPIWVMNFPPVATTRSVDASTSLWRTESFCQFTPNERAVVELLRFVGFPNITRLKPKERSLDKRYFEGRWGTFIAMRE
jgi:tRNA (mo5U34)-methyltransferase